ncbi:ankyrin repeat domain-containing protein [Archangium sp.]|jgi:hypothetical protein|uniref:ankyrin repeat domain-containing protein n=1 Tax=Archangium sp. TaxID=1872627 RepID=UPI002ED81353
MSKKWILVGLLFAATAQLNVARADDWSEIRAAVYYTDDAKLAQLLDSGVDINIQDSDGWTPLHVAAEQGLLRTVNYLLARGANPNIKTTRGRTAYDVASGYAQVQAALKAKMAPPQDPFAPYLNQGARPGVNKTQPPVAQPAPASPGTPSRNGPNDGRSPQMRPRLEARDAVWYNNADQLAALLDEGLDVNMPEGSTRETLLHAAAWRDRVEIARLLLARGANTSLKDKDGKRPIDYAQSPEMRALLGGGTTREPPPTPAPSGKEAHCKNMWHEATALCGIGNSMCNTSAHVRYQKCMQTGTWY